MDNTVAKTEKSADLAPLQDSLTQLASMIDEAVAIIPRINEVSTAVNQISVTNSWKGIKQWQRAKRDRDQLEKTYRQLSSKLAGGMAGGPPAQGSAIMIQYVQMRNLGGTLGASFALQNSWQNLNGALDRKSAFLAALVGIYIAVFSLVVSVVLAALQFLA